MQGAVRETLEEAKAKAVDLHLYRIFDIPYINQIYMFYRCHIQGGDFGVGAESAETALFSESDIPWDNLAFSVVHDTLKEYFSDLGKGLFPVRVSTALLDF